MSQGPNKPQPAAAKPAPAAPQPAASKPAPGKPVPAAAAPAGPPEEEFIEGGGGNFLLFNAMPSVLTSMIVHAVGLVILALMVVAIDNKDNISELVMGPDNKEEVEETEEIGSR